MDRLTTRSILGGWTIQVPRQEAVDRLAAYEDTELEPEEVAALVKAQDEGRVVVLPCKVGGTMYSSVLGQIKMFEVAGFEIYGPDIDVIEQRGTMREHRRYGKEAHLTRAEAEAALTGGSGDGP